MLLRPTRAMLAVYDPFSNHITRIFRITFKITICYYLYSCLRFLYGRFSPK